MWLIAGLGNPGAKYELTRHNFGFLAVDSLLEKFNIKNLNKKFNSECASLDIAQQSCLVIKPQTFMNVSGQAIQQAMSFYKIPLDQVVIIHDEIDLALGEIRIKKGGSHGGHNGLRDISRLLGPEYNRIRLGVGRPNFKGNEADYVLSNFSNAELILVEEVLASTILALNTLIEDGLDKAQQNCQVRPKKF